ncbi:trypsin-like serine peptidase [Pseudoalteromonas sp. A25]|uniref:trypsin-like serine peptidase n=1 Tax=Pseudoalteromonas sp. A25 TaxID=116092 RepID=UPI00126046B7|nr:hypothetical protein [Pseudoalteromonas sp. A25]
MLTISLLVCINYSAVANNKDSKHSAGKEWDKQAQPGDTRQVRTASSPAWLAAVGQMKMQNGKEVGDCTLVLVGHEDTRLARVAITNSHCIEDLYAIKKPQLPSKVKVTFTTERGEVVNRTVTDIFSDGRFVYSLDPADDYAIVVLDKAISASVILPLVYEADFAYNYRDFIFDPEYNDDPEMAVSRKTYKEIIAGYSADLNEHLGRGGKNLTYDDNCLSASINEVEEQGNDIEVEKVKNCYAYPGASGGAFVVSYYDTEEENIYGSYGKQIVVLVGLNRGTQGEKVLSNGQYDRSFREIVPILNFVDDLDEAVEKYNTTL